MESNQFKMLQREEGTHHTFEVSIVHCSSYKDFSLKEPIYLQRFIHIQVSVCYVWERNVMCTSKWSKNTQISESGTCCYLTILGVTMQCCSITHVPCYPHNQNILQNPHTAEMLPNNWINQGQRWISHITLSASKLPADTELQQCVPPPKKAILMHFSCSSCLPFSTSVRQHHLQ